MTMSATMIAKTLKGIQRCNKIPNKQIAEWAGVSESAASRYGIGDRNIPEDVIVNIARNGGLDELKIAYRAEKRLGLINVPLMNNIDDNIQCMILRIMTEEIPEAVEALKRISSLTMNKKELNMNEIEVLYKQMEQVADLIPGIETFFIRLKQIFNISLEKIDLIECEKFKQKQYVVDLE
jgi:hypothetical protein